MIVSIRLFVRRSRGILEFDLGLFKGKTFQITISLVTPAKAGV